MMGMRTPLDRELVGFAENLCFMWTLFIEGSLAQGVRPAWFLTAMQERAYPESPFLSPARSCIRRENRGNPRVVGARPVVPVYNAAAVAAIGNWYRCLLGRTLWR